MKKQISYVLLTLIALTSSAFAVGEGRVVLDGAAEETNMRLFWQVYGWPDDVVSFNIHRRLKDDNIWHKLNQNPIYPEVSLDRSWKDSGLNAEQENEYRDKLDEYLGTKFGEINSADFLEMLQKRGMRAGDRIRLKQDFSLVLMMGFGYIDNDYTPQDIYEYAVFGVDNSVVVESKESAKGLTNYQGQFEIALSIPSHWRGVTFHIELTNSVCIVEVDKEELTSFYKLGCDETAYSDL